MTRAMTSFALREWRDFLPSPWLNTIAEIFSLVVTLGIYWFTARAFMALGGKDYFSYVVAGDALLFLPLVLFEGVPRALRAAAAEGTLELYLVEPVAAQRSLIAATLAMVPREATRACATFLVGFSLFTLAYSPARVPLALFSFLAGAPAFLGLGLFGASTLVVFGRGSSALGQLAVLACVLAGAYFPLGALPPGLASVARLSPFTLQLELSRAILSGERLSGMSVVALLAQGAVLFAAGYWSLGLAFRRARASGKPLHFPV